MAEEVVGREDVVVDGLWSQLRRLRTGGAVHANYGHDVVVTLTVAQAERLWRLLARVEQ